MESTELISKLVASFIGKVNTIPSIVMDVDPYDGIGAVGKNESRLIHPLDDDLERMYLLSNYSSKAAGVCKSLNQQADHYDFTQISNILMAAFWSLARDRYDLKDIFHMDVRVHDATLCIVSIDVEAVKRDALFQLADLAAEYEKHRAEQADEKSKKKGDDKKSWLN